MELEKYDYEEVVRDDVEEAVREYIQDGEVDLSDYDSIEDLYEYFYDVLWTDDDVTGNGSGSYWFNTWKAEAALCHNGDMLLQAMEEFGDTDYAKMIENPEAADVTIRCWLLGRYLDEAIETVLDELGVTLGEEEV